MSIKKDVYIPVLQGKTRTVYSEGKNELSDATNEVLDKIYFRVIDDNRKVNVGTTALLIYEINKWLKSYKEKIIPNILEPTNPSLEKEKNKIYRDTIAWVEKWEHWKEALIPENRGVIGGVDLEVDRFHFVKLNDKLLDPNKSLTYNQALFLLLGLNTIALDNELADFPEYATFTGTRPTGRYSQFDFIFWDTPQNQALRTSAFVVDGKITSEKLKKLADDNDFFTNQYESPKNNNLTKTQRQSTIDQQSDINKIAKDIMLKYPKSTKTSLSIDVAEALENSLTPAAILRDYLKEYPDF